MQSDKQDLRVMSALSILGKVLATKIFYLTRGSYSHNLNKLDQIMS